MGERGVCLFFVLFYACLFVCLLCLLFCFCFFIYSLLVCLVCCFLVLRHVFAFHTWCYTAYDICELTSHMCIFMYANMISAKGSHNVWQLMLVIHLIISDNALQFINMRWITILLCRLLIIQLGKVYDYLNVTCTIDGYSDVFRINNTFRLLYYLKGNYDIVIKDGTYGKLIQ